jgi:prophage tail gpP-like protein
VITIEVNGVKYEGFLDVNVEQHFDTACSSFSFTSTSDKKLYSPVKVGDAVRICVKNIPLVTGYVDKITPKYTSDSHDISIEGRSKTADIVDSTVSGNIDLKAPISLKRIIERVISSLGITDIKVFITDKFKSFTDEDLNPTQNTGLDEPAGQDVSAKVGENAFDFIEKYCRKRQVFFTTDGDGNIVIARASNEIIDLGLFNKVDGQNNNIKSASSTIDNSQRFYKYVLHSQSNTAEDMGEGFASSKGVAYDKEIRKTRVYEMQADVASDMQTATDRAKWEANIRRARSFVYSCNVQGFFINAEETELWRPNILVKVVDDFEDINSELLVKSVKFSYSADGGNLTDLDLVTRDAFTLQAAEKQTEAQWKKESSAVKTSKISSKRGIV